MDWSAIEPAILGTLFERGLNPDMRSLLGAHYTDPATIMKLIRPVVEVPLLAEWEPIKVRIDECMKKYQSGGKGSQTAYSEASAIFIGFLERLKEYRVLDPACGSGNFLYLALKALKDLEHRVNLEAEALGLHRQMNVEVSPANVLGIEINPYAAELARVSVWIGEIQWMLAHGYAYRRDPILRKLDHIENRDAVLNGGDGEAEWPAVDAIVGNPPFLGGSKKRGELGEKYFNALSGVYKNRVPDGADLVCYWFEKARTQIQQGNAQQAGLVATQAIRAGANRRVLERIVASCSIFEAWSDETWVNVGAAVRVSLVCFGGKADSTRLDGRSVGTIHADLTARIGVDLTLAKALNGNIGVAFKGAEKNGAFDITGKCARQWMLLPNPHGKPNENILKPWANGIDITSRPSDTWIVDFGIDMPESDAALYEKPFTHVLTYVKPERDQNRDPSRKKHWWRFGRSGADMRAAIQGLSRFIVTPRVAKHRFFVWLPASVSPDSRLFVIARDDDATFGILSSRMHEVWSLATASMHGVGNDPTYNAKSCFETFPFPMPRAGEAVETRARRLDELRNQWLNPPEWVAWIRTSQEEKAGYPPRPVAKAGHEADLKKRTLTNLYNARPAWLDNAHKELDVAVAAAYGWRDYTPEMPDEEILRRLLTLNLERANEPSKTIT